MTNESDLDSANEPIIEPSESTPSVTRILVGKLLAGDRTALEPLYQRHQERILRAAALALGSVLGRCQATVEDAAQDAWEAAIVALDSGRFQPDTKPGAFRRWMTTIVANRCRDRKRGEARKRVAMDPGIDLAPESIDSIGAQAARSELFDQVEGAMLMLSDRDRDVLTMKHLHGMTNPEICATLGLERTAQVGYIAHRALTRLRTSASIGRLADVWVSHFGT